MGVPSATVDTSVVIDAIERTDPAAVMLFERAIRGDFDLAVSTRLSAEMTKSRPTPELRAYLERTAPLGSPARWDVTTWDGGDYWADASDVAAGNDFDGDHVAAHRRSGRDYFITRDRRQATRARAVGVAVLTPDELLSRFPADPC